MCTAKEWSRQTNNGGKIKIVCRGREEPPSTLPDLPLRLLYHYNPNLIGTNLAAAVVAAVAVVVAAIAFAVFAVD